MNAKSEGAVFTPVPVVREMPEARKMRFQFTREATDPACEMCGHSVITTHCKRICLHCGFMTGCSEGI